MREMVGGCCVCSDERGWDENPLVYCDGVCCSVAVHQACYGIVCVPTGPWFCRKCESQERSARVRCELCPRRDGALKRTDSSSWAHVVCALYIPEVRFGNVSTMEPIVLGLVPPDRYIQSCYLCVKGGRQNRASCGACMQCNRPGCKQSFHVTCAQSQGLLCEEAGNYLDNVKYCGYCEYHYSKINKKVIKTIPAYKPVSSSISSLSPCSSPDKMEIKSCATNTSTFNKKNKKSRCHRSGSVPYTSNISTITLMNSITDNSRASTQLVTLDSTPSSKSSQVFISDLQPANEEIRMCATSLSSKFSELDQLVCSRSTKEEDSGSEVNEVLSIENSTVFKIDDVGPVSQSTKNDGKLISSEKLEVRDVSNKVINEPNSNDSKISAKQGSEVHLNSVDILKTSPVPSSSTCKELELLVSQNANMQSTSVPPVFTSSPQTCDSSINNPTPSIISSSVVTQISSEVPINAKSEEVSRTTVHSEISTVLTDVINHSDDLNLEKAVIESTDEYAFSQENNAKDLSVRSLYNGVNKRGIGRPPGKGAQIPSDSISTSGLVEQFSYSSDNQTARSPISSPELESASSLKKKRKRLSNCIKLPTSVSNTGNEKASTVWMMGTSINPTSNVAKEMNVVLENEITSHSSYEGLFQENLVGVSVPIKNEKGMSDISSKRYHIQPQSLKDLLERQWEQGSHFIMEQASHFDIASLLSSLNQLKEENVELEHNVDKLIQRRDHLLAVRARLMAISINNVQSSGMCQFSEVGRYNTCQQQQQQQSSYINGPSRNNSTVDSPARATQLSAVGNISTMGNILCSVGGSQEFHKMTRSIENGMENVHPHIQHRSSDRLMSTHIIPVSSSSSISRTHNIHQSIQHNLTHVRYNTFSFVPPFTATSNGSATVSHQSTNQHHILALDGSTHHLRNNVRTIDKR